MADEKQIVTVVVESFQNNEKAVITVAELGMALTVANRIVNGIAAQHTDRKRHKSARYEPDIIQLEVQEIRTGSVLLQALMELMQNDHAQGVAIGVLANNLTPVINKAVRSSASSLRRLSRASAGKAVQLTIKFKKGAVRIRTEFDKDGRASTQVSVPPDDVQ